MPLYPLGISRSRDVPRVTDETAVKPIGVRWILSGKLAGAVAPPHFPPKPLQHAAALARIHRRICILPMRFGTLMSDEEEVCALLLKRRKELLECLDRVDGASEISLRISLPLCQLPETELPPMASRPRPTRLVAGPFSSGRSRWASKPA